MYKRWVSVYDFQWTPIITYTRRYLQLLDWFEQNIDLVAFVDGPSRVGIAVGAEDLRLTVHQRGMTIETGVSGLATAELLPAIEGVFQVMAPKETVLTLANSVATVELEGADYSTARRLFARSVAGTPAQVAGLTSIDASVLLDLNGENSSSAQVEWGIVESPELLYRLRNPRAGRILSRGGDDGNRRSLKADATALLQRLPSVSVFVEVVSDPGPGGDVTDTESIGDVIVKEEDMAEQLTLGFAERFKQAEASAKEGSTW